MFSGFQEFLRKRREEASRRDEARAHEERRKMRAQQEVERHIRAVKVITGEVRYRYVIIDTLRAHGYFLGEAGQPLRPTEATDKAIRSLQEQAHARGAQAVIHAQFHVLRYAIPQRNLNPIPAYETHVFGTAIRIIGPPPEWEDKQ